MGYWPCESCALSHRKPRVEVILLLNQRSYLNPTELHPHGSPIEPLSTDSLAGRIGSSVPSRSRWISNASACAVLASWLLALPARAGPPQSMPQPQTVPNSVPQARDVAYPGTIKLAVDATDTARRIFRVREVIPVAPGPLTLMYPQWVPGDHSPTGPLQRVGGFRFTANGKTIAWRRDPVNLYALHLVVPEGTKEVLAEFQHFSPTAPDQGRVLMTPEMLNLPWNVVLLLPAGYFARRVPVEATVVLPKGWRYATALEPTEVGAQEKVQFKQIDVESLVDSPLFAGRYFRQERLAADVRLNVFADNPGELAATPEQLEMHRRVVEQTIKLFGAQHYDHYDFLMAITDRMGAIGFEHHRSSESNTSAGYFTKWGAKAVRRGTLPHEFIHSWNGKFRRGADLFTADFSTPARNSLLWVYEGQTQFWAHVLEARSGLLSHEEALGALAWMVARYEARVGRQWRSLADTTNDPIIAMGRPPQPSLSWQRSEDYYGEGQLLWLDVDMLIRELTQGKRSLDDFAKAFFGLNDRDWGTVTYTSDDVVRALQRIAPHDWAGFLRARVDELAPHPPLGWLARGGYKLVEGDEPNPFWIANEKEYKISDFTTSIGFIVDKDNTLTQVIWDGPAFVAGLAVGAKLVALNGQTFDVDALKTAIKDARTSKKPIELWVKHGDAYRVVSIPYFDGPRYPRLEKVGTGTAPLDALLAPLK